MKKIIYILLIFNLLPDLVGDSICNLYSQWVQQVSGVTTPLYNVQFVNRFTGWVTGSNSVILKTTNGGINWFSQSIDLGYQKNLNGLNMLDVNTGYIVGHFEAILKTTNSGINWNIISNIPTNNGNTNNAVSFINPQTGWICSFLGRVLRTTNGGSNWDTANIGNTGPLLDIQFLNSQTGWVCGDVGNLKKSTNGGINWLNQSLLTTGNLTGLHFLDINTGWIVSEQDNYVFKTTNSGIKWDTVSKLPGGSSQYSYTIYFSSQFTGYVGGTFTRLFKTTNGGFTWYRDNVNNLGFINNFSFYNDSVGWAVGGRIIHTTNGGSLVSINTISEIVPENFKLYQNFPNPFNPITKIRFDVKSMHGIDIKLIVHDILGKEITTLVNELLNHGTYEIKFDGSNLSSGVYFYTLKADNYINTKIMTIVK